MTSLEDWQLSVAWIVFVATYGVLSPEQAFRAHETLVLLFSTMIIVSFLMNSGILANLIVAEKARPAVVIDFWSYTRIGLPLIGLPLMVVTMATGLLYWHFRYGL